MLEYRLRENPDAIQLDHVAGDVRFADVSFRYRGNTPLVLDRLNLHVRAGETVALVGPSGGGKTTLSKLLLHLYDPFSGEVVQADLFLFFIVNSIMFPSLC